ncbi:J domain-containing protein DDB_G0295729-like [Diachasmimorpha longicaudata]|uniref:J domain-containing protein DDB_G0295729-like n=1 Tax=Diachasmimorpha longicaudata TaxID=58733 RepID=UPI0030B8DE47
MTKELLQHYTAQKKTGDKLLFTTLPIWSCIKEELKKEASKKKIPEYKDAELLQGLGGTINNCRSWKNNNEDHNDNNGRDEDDNNGRDGGNVVEDGAQNADD